MDAVASGGYTKSKIGTVSTGSLCCVTGGGKEYLHNHPTVFVGDANCTHPVALACTTILFPGADVAQMVRLASPFLQSHQSYDVPERAWLVGAAVCRTVAEPACGREEAAGDADVPRPKDTETKAKDKATKAMRRVGIASPLSAKDLEIRCG